MKRSNASIVQKCCEMCLIAGVVSLWTGGAARADLVLGVSSVKNELMTFTHSGSGASAESSITFGQNSSHESFQVGESSSLSQSSIGLYGAIHGTFSYTKGAISSDGSTAPLTTTSGSTFSIVDLNGVSLTAQISGVEIYMHGGGGSVNDEGSINLANVSYSGLNSDLIELRNEANSAVGASIIITFQFPTPHSGPPVYNLTTLTGINGVSTYSGVVSSFAVPEPTSLALGCIAVGPLAIALRRRKSRSSEV